MQQPSRLAFKRVNTKDYGMVQKQSKKRRRHELRATSLDAAIEASIAIMDRDGLEALTIRSLAEDLGIGTMTLYSYVGGKADLLDQIALRLLGKIPSEIPTNSSWNAHLIAIMTRLYQILRQHPGVAAISLTPRGPVAALDPLRELILRILHDVGFPPRDAVNALTALVTYVTGYSIVEHARTDIHIEKERSRLAGLPKREFPHLSAAANLYAAQFSRRTFEAGLKSLIDGLAAELSQFPAIGPSAEKDVHQRPAGSRRNKWRLRQNRGGQNADH
jgi:AcrR family transcriptional regulator